MEPAPFHSPIADAPEGAKAFWATAPDGVRLRLALLAPPPDGCRGTVLLFTGRTEYVEKYGPAAAELQRRGLAVASLDWRGQGLSDRALNDPATGHVRRFSDYQTDVSELLKLVEMLGLTEPLFLLGHSMGGGIGLRSLHNGLPVKAAAFSGPMWGIQISPIIKPVAQLLAALSHSTGFGHTYVPSTKPTTYVLDAEFEDNTLTTDPEMFNWMQHQIRTHPELALGGPSMTWLNEALKELRVMRGMPLPTLPTTTWVGSNERIVDTEVIHRLMSHWTNGSLHVVENGEHELMMEKVETRTAFFDTISDLFLSAGTA